MPFSGFQDLDPTFGGPLQRLLAMTPGVSVNSGYRTPERQAKLYADAVRKYGSEQAARGHVAPPGRSFHNKRLAADLAYANPAAREAAHRNAKALGLTFPVGGEDWHVELASNRNGGGGGDSGGGAVIALDDSTAPLLVDALNPSPYRGDLGALATSAYDRVAGGGGAGGDRGGQPKLRETGGDRAAPLLETETASISPEMLAAPYTYANKSDPSILTNPASLADLFRVKPIGQAGTPPTLPGRRF